MTSSNFKIQYKQRRLDVRYFKWSKNEIIHFKYACVAAAAAAAATTTAAAIAIAIKKFKTKHPLKEIVLSV